MIRNVLIVLACLCVGVAGFPASVQAQSMRVDGRRVQLPANLHSSWERVEEKRDWTSGPLRNGESQFVRFIGRLYEFHTVGAELQVTTKWYSGNNCVRMTRAASAMSPDAIESLESAVQRSVEQLRASLLGGSKLQETVMWAQFSNGDREIVLPVTQLEASDQQVLAVFTERAGDAFSSRIKSDDGCSEREESQRETPTRRPGSKSDRTAATGRATGIRPNSGNRTTGVSTQTEGGSQGEGVAPEEESNDGEGEGKKQRFGFLVSIYEAKRGSLQFQLVASLKDCILAETEERAYQLAMQRYPAKPVGTGATRRSYRINPSNVTCEPQGLQSASPTDVINESGPPSGPQSFGASSTNTTPGRGSADIPSRGGPTPLTPIPDDDAHSDDEPYPFDDEPFPDLYDDYARDPDQADPGFLDSP